MDKKEYFQGKKVTVMGLGVLGRGVGDAVYLAECGAELIVTDLKSREALLESVAKLEGFPNVTFVLGEHRLEDFRGRDFVLKAAGVPLESPYIAEAQKAGVPVYMSASLFMSQAGIPVIGVTGTRGKSTVTHMLHLILAEAGKKVLLGGNVRGVSTLALLKEVTPEHVALFELDSWQLQGFGDAKMSPQLSIFTTFYPDHLAYYHNDLDRYLRDKANIFLYQSPKDTLVLGSQVSSLITERYGSDIQASVVEAPMLPQEWELPVPGEHNRYNAGIALAAARTLEVPDDASRSALKAFSGVPGRLERIAVKEGVTVYNDTNSTTPEATLAALRALDTGKRNIILIMGGHDKNLSMDELLAALPQHTKHVTLLAGSGTDRIREQLPGASVFDSLPTAVEDALSNASPGDVVLLSPAFSSFGMFKNEYDRGDQFSALFV